MWARHPLQPVTANQATLNFITELSESIGHQELNLISFLLDALHPGNKNFTLVNAVKVYNYTKIHTLAEQDLTLCFAI